MEFFQKKECYILMCGSSRTHTHGKHVSMGLTCAREHSQRPFFLPVVVSSRGKEKAKPDPFAGDIGIPT